MKPKPQNPLTAEHLDKIRKCATVGLSMAKTARFSEISICQLESGPGAEAYLDGLIAAEFAAGHMLLAKAKEGDIGCLRQYIDRLLKAEPHIERNGSE
jgi:hypothetical protein